MNGFIKFTQDAQTNPILVAELIQACRQAMLQTVCTTSADPQAEDLQKWFHKRSYLNVTVPQCRSILDVRASSLAAGEPDSY
jgi:hypothetical protein